MAKTSVFLLMFFTCFCFIQSLPEPGLWEEVDYDKEKGYLFFVKSLYKDSIISVTIQCTDCEKSAVTVDVVLRNTPCTQEYSALAGNKNERTIMEHYLKEPDLMLFPDYEYKVVEYMKFSEERKEHQGYIQMIPQLNLKPTISNVTVPESDDSSPPEDEKKDENERRKRADAAPTAAPAGNKVTSTQPTTAAPAVKQTDAPIITLPTQAPGNTTVAVPDQSGRLVKIWKSGYYLLIIKITDHQQDSKFKVTVSMKGSVGYISAVEWPLLIFYGVMGLVYIFYAFLWLVMLACNWRDLLRVQYWIGAVILLGMMEKAVFYGDYQSISNNGKSWTEGAVIFAEVVSCLKRALARMLVIIVSLGFGIVKPRLGTTLHKVLFVGGLYFLLATVEGSMRGLRPKGDQSTDMMLAAIPLAIVDASICWWIFSSLVQTTRQLRLRRNIVKLTLYRHFTNTLVFAILASIIFMIWSIIQIKTKTCIRDWQELWIDEAFWHLLFSVLLIVIMILWRPSTNNQRYAFSPLLDHGDDDEEEEAVMNDAFDGMKMRPKQANGSPKQKQNTIEDELKWVEENIPSAISDTAQSILESDEEIMTAKYEMSKMQ